MRPETNDDYEVLDFIGRGGYGEVFLARDKAGLFWAVKVVYRVSFDHDRPFEREFDGISKFEPISQLSESQLQIVHVGRRDKAGYFYYIMELADDITRGRDIQPEEYFPHTLKSELQQRGRIDPNECCHLARALTVALENLHQHRLVHRDIKPANIIFVKGRPKLADPGLVTDADKSMTCAGTDGYIPPEGPGSARADIYSLGIVLYEAMTGNSRWDFPKLPQDFEEWPQHETALELNRIINKACHAKLRKRYQSARELERDLEALILRNNKGQNKATGIASEPRKPWRLRLLLEWSLVTMLIAAAGWWTWAKRPLTSPMTVTSSHAFMRAQANAPASPDGQWQGVEEAAARHWQELSFTKSPEGKLQAEMKDLSGHNYIRTPQSLELNTNHLKIVFIPDDRGRLVTYEGDIDYAWKRISGTLVFVSPNGQTVVIPLHFDYMGADGDNPSFAKDSTSAIPSSLIGQWQGQVEWNGKLTGDLWKFEFTRSGGALRVEQTNITKGTAMTAQSTVFVENHLKVVFCDNGRLKMYEGNVDYSWKSISGTWTGPKGHFILRLESAEP